MKGSKEPYKLALSADGELLAAGSLGIKLWDMSSRKSSRRLAGHALPVTCMAFTPDRAFLVSGCDDRYISLWATAPEDEGTAAVRAFSAEGAPRSLCLRDTADGKRDLMSLDDSGVVCVWRLPLDGGKASGKKSKKKGGGKDTAVCRVAAAGGAQDGQPVFCAEFDQMGGMLVVARGSEAAPQCESVAYTSADGSALLDTVELEALAAGGALARNAPEGKVAPRRVSATEPSSVTVLGAAEMPAAALGAGGRSGAEEASLGDMARALDFEGEDEGEGEAAEAAAPSTGTQAALLIQALQVGRRTPRRATQPPARAPAHAKHTHTTRRAARSTQHAAHSAQGL